MAEEKPEPVMISITRETAEHYMGLEDVAARILNSITTKDLAKLLADPVPRVEIYRAWSDSHNKDNRAQA